MAAIFQFALLLAALWQTAGAQLRSRSSYLNDATEQFVVNGTGVPGIPFDIGESYAGLLPVSDDANETKKLYFWFFPSANAKATDEILVWLNGGPGCSSLFGLMQENGPILWQPGTPGFVRNTYSWTNLTNVVYIEQPVGTGFSQGTATARDQFASAEQFAGFWKNFATAFGLEGRKIYLTGESYAGFYIPYIAAAFIDKNDTTYYNVSGVELVDPLIGDRVVQGQVFINPFGNYWANVLRWDNTFIPFLNQMHQLCGFADYISQYFKFPPPPGPFRVIPQSQSEDACDLASDAYGASGNANPCFSAYHITSYCPAFADPQPAWLSRADVQQAIHAPVGTQWVQCVQDHVVFPPFGDPSVTPAQNGVLQKVIEHTNNVVIGVGSLDYLLPVNGTILVLQNVTWNGLQGFQSYPNSKLLRVPHLFGLFEPILSEYGIVGTWAKERGLTFFEAYNAGHQMPRYAPGTAYRSVEYLLGRIGSLDDQGAFTTA